MRNLIKIALVALGIRAFLRWRKRRQAEAAAVTEPQPAADPADELRQKLAETRTEDVPAEDVPATPESTVEDRRSDVHGQGRAALDDMNASDES